jgi:hypothetical protein
MKNLEMFLSIRCLFHSIFCVLGSGSSIAMDTQATGAGYDKISDPGLLEKIDKLFAHNVGDLIELPQLVVVGDQSSGKSSVLAGLTKLPFPRDSGLCTRFATQITFRRSAEKRIKVSIIPRPNASEAHATQVTEWGTSISEMSADSFAKILSDVCASNARLS